MARLLRPFRRTAEQRERQVRQARELARLQLELNRPRQRNEGR